MTILVISFDVPGFWTILYLLLYSHKCRDILIPQIGSCRTLMFHIQLERKTSVGMAVTRAFGDSHRPWWRRPSFYGFRGSVHEFYYKLSHGSAYAMILDRDILLDSCLHVSFLE
jgi:hypothetical protein